MEVVSAWFSTLAVNDYSKLKTLDIKNNTNLIYIDCGNNEFDCDLLKRKIRINVL